MISTEDLKFFAAVAGAASLAGAARTLGVSPSAVTQRLRQLEQRLQVRLVERSSRPMLLTEEGALLAERGSNVLNGIDGIVDELGRRSRLITGCLRVAAPFGFGRKHIAPVLGEMSSRNPRLELALWLFDDPASSLSNAHWDVLVHVGPIQESMLTMRRLAPNRRILCAAPAYLERHGTPKDPRALTGHRCGVVREDQADVTFWRFSGPNKEKQNVRIRPCFSSNDGEVVRAWSRGGLGIIVRSEWDVADDLAAGRLVEVLPQWSLPDADVVALLGSRTERLTRTSSFLDMLGAALCPTPWRL